MSHHHTIKPQHLRSAADATAVHEVKGGGTARTCLLLPPETICCLNSHSHQPPTQGTPSASAAAASTAAAAPLSAAVQLLGVVSSSAAAGCMACTATAAAAGIPDVVLHDKDHVKRNAQQRDAQLRRVACTDSSSTPQSRQQTKGTYVSKVIVQRCPADPVAPDTQHVPAFPTCCCASVL